MAAFLFAAAAIAAVVGTSLVFPNTLLDQLWDFNKRGAAAFHALGWIAGALLLALGGATCAAASGLLRRKQWAWWFTIVLFAIDGTGDVISFSVTGDFLRSASGAAISLAFLYALSRHRVIRYFKQPR